PCRYETRAHARCRLAATFSRLDAKRMAERTARRMQELLHKLTELPSPVGAVQFRRSLQAAPAHLAIERRANGLNTTNDLLSESLPISIKGLGIRSSACAHVSPARGIAPKLVQHGRERFKVANRSPTPGSSHLPGKHGAVCVRDYRRALTPRFQRDKRK